jgi:hypothetical protein
MKYSTKQTVMDIAMNLHRIGGWIADDFNKNEKKIKIFIANTDEYISSISNLTDKFKPTWQNFSSIYPSLKNDLQNNAENLLTWGNILTHRAKLI